MSENIYREVLRKVLRKLDTKILEIHREMERIVDDTSVDGVKSFRALADKADAISGCRNVIVNTVIETSIEHGRKSAIDLGHTYAKGGDE